MLYYFKAKIPTFLSVNYNFSLNFEILKQCLHQPQAMFICYPTIYDMTMLEFVSYVKILIEWKHRVYPDSILNPCTLTDDALRCSILYINNDIQYKHSETLFWRHIIREHNGETQFKI
jgi:hypothetical protein